MKQLRSAKAKRIQETASGAKTNRAELGKALRELAAGGVLMATRLYRLARSTRHLLIILAQIGERVLLATPGPIPLRRTAA